MARTYASRTYVTPGTRYDDYHPAYRYGWENAARYPDQAFDDAERELEKGWNNVRRPFGAVMGQGQVRRTRRLGPSRRPPEHLTPHRL